MLTSHVVTRILDRTIYFPFLLFFIFIFFFFFFFFGIVSIVLLFVYNLLIRLQSLLSLVVLMIMMCVCVCVWWLFFLLLSLSLLEFTLATNEGRERLDKLLQCVTLRTHHLNLRRRNTEVERRAVLVAL